MSKALFLGRFQPPHTGHLLTIQKLANQFEYLIVGVTESQPSIMPVEEVIQILKVLVNSENVIIIPVTGGVEEGTAVIDVEFDVCCSGNPNVIDIMKKNGFKTQYVDRSMDSLFEGTQIRNSFVEKTLACSAGSLEPGLTKFDLISLGSLRPIEKINPTHLLGIEKDLLDSGVMMKPLIIDRITRAVLDGSHRYAFLVKHGYQMAPVVECDYDNESIFVGTHLGHRFQHDQSKWISKNHVRATAISGKLYEPRTTRHFFPWRKEDIPTKLEDIVKFESASIDHLVEKVSLDKEYQSNVIYMSELEMEQKILEGYISEQREVLNWLKEQNEFIDSKR
jgi:cytidyltransferase-like protein